MQPLSVAQRADAEHMLLKAERWVGLGGSSIGLQSTWTEVWLKSRQLLRAGSAPRQCAVQANGAESSAGYRV